MDSSSRRPGQSGAPVDPVLRYGLRVWLHLALGWSSRSLQCLSARSARLSLVRSWSRRGHGGHAGNRRLPTAAGVSDPEKNCKSRSGLCGRRGDPGSGRSVFRLADTAIGTVARNSPGVVGARFAHSPPAATEQIHREGPSIQHRCTGCTGLAGRELPAREASSGDAPVRSCGFPA